MAIVFQILAVITLGTGVFYFLRRRRHRLSPVTMILCALALFLAIPQGAAAAEIKKAERYSLPAGETLKNDLLIFSGPVRIEGTVDGDIIAFCESMTIEGHVTGDVIVFTRRLTMNGTVDGSVRSFANNIDISGKVARSVMAFAEGLELRQGSDVGWGALLFGKSVDLAGRVGRDVTVHADRAGLEGYVAGSFQVDGGDLNIASTAEVLGKATYRGRKEPTVEAGAKLASPLERIVPDRKPRYYSFGFYWDIFMGYASVLALGLVIVLISPSAFRAVTREARRPGALIGAVVVLAVPVAAIIACITLVGFALGMVSAVLWLILLYVAQVYVGGSIGEMLLGPASTRGAQFGRLAAGLAVLRVASALRYILLPGAGPWLLFWLIIASWGIGAVTLAIYERARWKPTLAPPVTEPAL
jgi:cytoskeletal protein CcmA (bactofilin family)